MTVSTTNTRTSSIANGTQRTFYFDFALIDEDHLYVWTVNTATSGIAVSTTDFVLDDGWGANGGSITFNVDEQPADGITVLIERNVPATQETDYVPGDPFPADAHEDALDKLTMLIQGIVADTNYGLSLDRCIVVPRGDTATDLELPPAATRANQYLFFDDQGDVDITDSALGDFEISTYAKTLLDDETSSDARSTLEIYSSEGRYTKSQTGVMATLTDAATIVWDLQTQQIAKVTLGANRAMGNPTNKQAGGTYVLVITQPAAGAKTLTWGTAYKFENSIPPELSDGANETTIVFFWSDGTYMYGTTFWKEVT